MAAAGQTRMSKISILEMYCHHMYMSILGRPLNFYVVLDRTCHRGPSQ